MLKSIISLIAVIFSSNAMSETPEQYIQAAREGLSLQTSSHSATWHLGKEAHWSADLDTGLIVFQFADGMRATAPIQVVGTYNQRDGTFLWGWNHPSVPEPLQKHASLAKQWGDKNNVMNFVTPKVSCSENDAWSFAAVTNRLANANGVYRGPSGTTLVFMTFGEVKLEKAKP